MEAGRIAGKQERKTGRRGTKPEAVQEEKAARRRKRQAGRPEEKEDQFRLLPT